jgi:hypothetical protein
VVHQVAAHQAAAALQARGQHEPGVLDRVRGEDEDAAARRPGRVPGVVGPTVGPVLDVAHPAGLGVDVDLVGDGLGQQVDVPAAQRLGQRLPRVVLGLDRADRDAVVVALAALALLHLVGAHRPFRDEPLAAVEIRIGDAVAGLREAAHLQRVTLAVQVDLGAVHAPGDHLVQVGQRHAPHGEHVSLGERDAEVGLVLDVTRHAHLPLGLPVERLELVVAERPVKALAEPAGDVEVLGQHAQHLGFPVHRGAGKDPGVGRVRAVRAVLHQVAGGIGLAGGYPARVGAPGHGRVRIRRVRGLVVLGGGFVKAAQVLLVAADGQVLGRAGLQDEDPLARLAELVGHDRARDPAAHDDGVVVNAVHRVRIGPCRRSARKDHRASPFIWPAPRPCAPRCAG